MIHVQPELHYDVKITSRPATTGIADRIYSFTLTARMGENSTFIRAGVGTSLQQVRRDALEAVGWEIHKRRAARFGKEA